ncbi:MAG: hypothetical protein ACXAD7_05795 [Candidatus Kariarchaeaceae archaeon]|jgi:hypothetical protein
MPTIKVKIHQSLRAEDQNHEFEGTFTGIRIIDAIGSLLENTPGMRDNCLKDGNKRPGILYLVDKTELASLGLLESSVDDWNDIQIRIIPILHGG